MESSHVFVISIVAICVISGVITDYFKSKNKRKNEVNDRQWNTVMTTLEKLEQRMRVVEEIVSSSSYDLRQELSSLEQSTGDKQ